MGKKEINIRLSNSTQDFSPDRAVYHSYDQDSLNQDGIQLFVVIV